MSSTTHMHRGSRVTLQAIAAFAWFAMSCAATALDVEGVRFDEQMKVANTQLRLNGAGVRYAAGNLVRAYAAGLYLPTKIARASELRTIHGPKRIQLVMMRDINANDFGRAMMKALRANLSVDEQIRHINGITQMGGIFGVVPQMKKGESITIDSIPGTGVVIYVNGKRTSEVISDEAFFDAMAQIWIGTNPVEPSLKLALLGQTAPKEDAFDRLARY